MFLETFNHHGSEHIRHFNRMTEHPFHWHSWHDNVALWSYRQLSKTRSLRGISTTFGLLLVVLGPEWTFFGTLLYWVSNLYYERQLHNYLKCPVQGNFLPGFYFSWRNIQEIYEKLRAVVLSLCWVPSLEEHIGRMCTSLTHSKLAKKCTFTMV